MSRKCVCNLRVGAYSCCDRCIYMYKTFACLRRSASRVVSFCFKLFDFVLILKCMCACLFHVCVCVKYPQHHCVQQKHSIRQSNIISSTHQLVICVCARYRVKSYLPRGSLLRAFYISIQSTLAFYITLEVELIIFRRERSTKMNDNKWVTLQNWINERGIYLTLMRFHNVIQ